MISTILTVYKNKKSFLLLPVIAVLLVSVLAFNAKVFSTIDVKMDITFNGETWQTHKEDFNRYWFSKDKDHVTFTVDLSEHFQEEYKDERPFTIVSEGVDPSGIAYKDILDAQGLKQGVYEVKVPVAGDGAYAFTALITEGNAWGLDSGAPKTFTVEKDATAPDIVISGVEDGALYNSKVEMAFNIDEKNFAKENTKVTYTFNGQAAEAPISWYENIGRVAFDKDGEYVVTVESTDFAGNVSEKSVSFSINNKGAALSVTDDKGNELNDGNVYNIDSIKLKATNGISLQSATMVIKKQGTDEEIQVEATVKNREATGTHTGLAEGTYTVYVTVKEKHQNGQEYTLPTFTFTVDKTAPTTSISGVENDGRYETEKKVTFRTKDANIDLSRSFITITKDGNEWMKNQQLNEDEQGASFSYDFYEDGLYAITFTAVDLAGNTKTHEEFSFTVDTSKPNITYEGMSEEEKYYNKNLDVTFRVTDLSIDLDKTELEVVKDGGVPIVKPFQRHFFFYFNAEAQHSFTEDGSYDIKITAVDYFNQKDTVTKNIVIDKVKPVVSITGIENKKYKNPQKVDFKVSDQNLSLETTTLTVYKDGEVYELPKKLKYTSDTEASLMDVEFKEDGDYVLELESTDKAGNTTKHEKMEFTVDQSAPTITIDGVENNGHYPTDKAVIITLYDVTLDLENTEVTVKSNKDSTPRKIEPSKVKGKREAIYEQYFNEEGIYEITIRSKDTMENEADKKLKFVIDRTAPVLEVKGIDMDAYVKGGQKLTITANELHFADSSVTVDATITRADGKTEAYDIGKLEVNEQTSSLSHTFTEDGYYTIKVAAIDKAGNRAEDVIRRFTVDNIKPALDISGVTDKEYYASSKMVTLSVEEFHYYNNQVDLDVTKNGAPYYMGAWVNDKVLSSLTHEFNEDGDYVIKLTATDKAGNVADPKVTSFTIDQTAPVLSVTGVEDGEDYNRDMPVEVKLVDTNLDLSTTNLVITKNGNAYNAGSFKTSGGVATLNHIFKEEGKYKISFSATDKAKNKTVHEDISFIVDKTRPVVKIDGAADNSFNPGNKTVTLSIDELNYSTNEVDVIVTKDGRGYNMGTWKNTGKLSKLSHNFSQDGLYTISVSATDKAGNGPVTQKLTFTVDKVNPVINIEGADNDAHYNVDKRIQVAINDLNLDINKITVTKNGRGYSVGGFAVNGNTASLAHTFSQEGDYRIQVNATDKAGNSFSKELAFTIDKTAPVITPKVKGDGRTLKNGEFINSIFTPEFALDVAADSIVSMTLNNQTIASNRAPIASKDMKYNYRVVARDKAGNETVLEIGFTLDTTKPLLEITGIIEGFFNENMVPVIKYADIHLDESKSYIRLDGKPFTSGTALTEEKDYVLEVVATDLANNVSKRTIHFTIDKTAPSISFMDPISDKYFTEDVIPEFLIDSLSPYDIIALTLNGNPYEIGDPITEEGKHVLYFEIKDKAGNIKQLSVEFMIDKTPPKVLVDGVKEKGIYYDPVTVSLQLENPNDKILTVMINGELFEGDVEDIDGNKVIRSTFSDIKAYEIIVEAVDEAGNVERFVLPFEIADKSVLVKVYENKPLFFGGIAAGLLGAASAAAYAIRRRKQNIDAPSASRIEE
ncbi:Ig-like domain-containing protein [Bacillus tianshenii]|uniref:Ig-like domain-containing protein n=1 Tax=Sutcliffiella tianshenii TaxID=1463404 RepID=UPI001CD213FD|nr:Ig-like domain-containing protein [Bacillus tianshenii]MCA1320438.1 Ig-like domain-containing protein [Bacillus tianshenii]